MRVWRAIPHAVHMPNYFDDSNLQNAFNQAVLSRLPSLALIMGGLFIILTLLTQLTTETDATIFLSLAMAVFYFASYLALKRVKLPLHLAHPVAASLIGVALPTLTYRLLITNNTQGVPDLIWVIVIASTIFLSRQWFGGLTAVTLLIWGGLVWFGQAPLYNGFYLLVATLVGTIIQSFRLHTYQRIEDLRQQLKASRAISQNITAILDLNSLLQRTIDLVQEHFGYDYVGLCLVDNHSDTIKLSVETAVSTESIYFTENGAPAAAIAQKNPIYVNKETNSHLSHNLQTNMRCELALPLMIGAKCLGVLDIQSKQTAVINQDDIPALQLLAAQIAVTIRNAILYQCEESRRRLSETLYDIGLALSSSLNREIVLDLILEQLATIVHYDRVSLLLSRDKELEIVAAKGFPPGSHPLQIRIPLGDKDDIFLQIYHSQQYLIIPDVTQHPNWTQVETLPQAKAWLGVPLIHAEQVIGMLSLVSETNYIYNEEDASLATAFAGQAAVALQNARLYNRIGVFNQQLEYEIRQRTEAVLQLAQLDQAKTDFIKVAAHELRTPLTTIKGYSQMLLNDSHIVDSTYHNELVSGMHQGILRLHEVINNLLDVAKIDNSTLELHSQPVVLHLLIQLICESLEDAIKQRKLTVTTSELENLPHIQADLNALRTVFSHLIVNAIKYTPDGGKIHISGRIPTAQDTTLPNGSIEMMIRDTGIGIDPDVHELIFNKFYQTGAIALHSSGKTKFKGGGPGLGLAIVRGIVEAHQGKVWVESPGYNEKTFPGSTFHVALPLQQNHTSK